MDISFGALNYTVLAVYLVVMFAIGLSLAGKQRTTVDYFLAGRRMPWIVVGMSMFASLTSAISYMGLPASAIKENVSYIVIAIMSPIVAPFLIIIFYPFYRRLSVTTSYEYIAVRFGAGARLAVSSLFILARLGWLGAVVFAPALALSTVTGMSLPLAIVLMAVLATSYTALGGLSAVLWTDVIQFIILAGGAVWVAVVLILEVPDGFGGIMTMASETGRLDVFSFKLSLFQMSALTVAFSVFFQLMQDYGTDQVTVQRLLAVKSSRGVAKAICFNAMTDLAIVALLLFVGLGIFAYYEHFPNPAAVGISPDRMLPFFIIRQLPPGVSGILITGIFAAAMSSMDSGINSLSTVVVNDFVKPFRPSRSDHQNVVLARVLTVAFGLFAMLVAFFVSRIEHILQASNTFLGLFAGPILGLFLLGMLTRRGSFRGWLVSTPVAIAITGWFAFFAPTDPDVKVLHWIWYFPICFGISFVGGYLMSLVLKTPLADATLTMWGRSQLEQRPEQ